MLIIGTDEAGRGPLAGPVVAAAVLFPEGYSNPQIKDSKQLSAKKRDKLFDTIKADSLAWAIVAVGHERIKALNILHASTQAMALSVTRVMRSKEAALVRVDGNVKIPISWPQETVIGGDRLHVEISAASILAKCYRDRLMEVLAVKYPGYGFEIHNGYPTKYHREQVRLLGPCRIHRVAFRGVAEFVEKR